MSWIEYSETSKLVWQNICVVLINYLLRYWENPKDREIMQLFDVEKEKCNFIGTLYAYIYSLCVLYLSAYEKRGKST